MLFNFSARAYANALNCQDVLLSDSDLYTIAATIADFEIAMTIDPQFQSNPSYRYMVMDKLQSEMNRFLSINPESALKIYQEARLQAKDKQAQLRKPQKSAQQIKQNEMMDLKNGSKVLADHEDNTLNMQITNDLRFLVSLSRNGKAKVFNMSKQKFMYELEGVQQYFISADGRYLAYYLNNNRTLPIVAKITVVSLETGQEIFNTVDINSVTHLHLSGDGQFLFIETRNGPRKIASIYDLKTGKLKVAKADNDALAYGKNNNLIAFSQEQNQSNWNFLDLDSGLVSQIKKATSEVLSGLLKKFSLSPLEIKFAEFSNDDRYLVTLARKDEKNFITIDEVASKTKVIELTYPSKEASFRIDSHNDRLFIILNKNDLRIIELSTGRELSQISYPNTEQLLLDFNNDYLVISYIDRANVTAKQRTPSFFTKIFDIKTTQELYQVMAETESNYSIAFSPDGKMLALGYGGGYLTVLNIANNEKYIDHANIHDNFISKLYFDSTGRFLYSTSGDGKLKVTNLNLFFKKEFR